MNGFPALSKVIETEDGYILNLHRIIGKKNESLIEALNNVKSKEPVLMVHGLLSSSENFVLNGPD